MPEVQGGAVASRRPPRSLKLLARSVLALGQTRLEIMGGEIEEQRTCSSASSCWR